jgi:signal transduction histidine kinase
MAVVINLAFWMVSYGMFYWGITCYRAIFSLGPWRYFKERTWLGRFLRFIKRWTLNALNVFNETDWERRSTKIIGKAIIANFVILTIISCLWFWGIGALVIYSLVLFFLLQKYWGQMQQKYNTLLKSINEIAEGNLDVEIQEDLGIFNPFKEQLSRIQDGFKKAVAQEVKSERTKSELITNVSHDLKTPITAIKGYVEGIMDGVASSPEKLDKYIRTIYNKANDMDRLIDELTFYSKIDTNKIPYTFSKINVSQYFRDCVEEVGLDMEARGIELGYFNYVDEDVVVIADAEQMKRVINNIISNSVKYLDKKKGIINIRIKDDGDFIQVEIEDNGKGIAAKDLPNIFDRFYRTDSSRNSSQGGSGIGLSIVRKIIEDHGGRIWATSKEAEEEEIDLDAVDLLEGIGTEVHFVLRKYQEVVQE